MLALGSKSKEDCQHYKMSFMVVWQVAATCTVAKLVKKSWILVFCALV